MHGARKVKLWKSVIFRKEIELKNTSLIGYLFMNYVIGFNFFALH